MTDQPAPWKVKIQGPVQRALAEQLPVGVATAALEFIQHVLPANPYRVGGELSGRFAGQHSAHLGEYRIIYSDRPRRTADTREVDPAPSRHLRRGIAAEGCASPYIDKIT